MAIGDTTPAVDSKRAPDAPERLARVAVFGLLAGLLITPATWAQEPGDLLARRLDPGDEIFVTDREGRQTDAWFLRVGPADLTVLVGDQQRTFDLATVGRVEQRDSIWNGVLIGALPLGLAAAGLGSNCSADCAGVIAAWTAMGGAVGALIDRQIRGYAVVYGPGLPSPHAIGQGDTVESLGALWTRVREGDALRITTSGGRRIDGRFVRASAESLVVLVDGRLEELTAEDVGRVRRRGNRYRSGALVAALLGAAAGTAACPDPDATGCDGGNRLGGAVVGAASGAFWGALVGAFLPRHAGVFSFPAPVALRVAPLVGRGRVGVALTASF